jgi:hypothetical protein
MRRELTLGIVRRMGRHTYAVYWSEEDGPRHAGRLELAPLHLLLRGGGDARVAIPLDEIDRVDYARGGLRLHRRAGPTITVGSLDAPGALFEFASQFRGMA